MLRWNFHCFWLSEGLLRSHKLSRYVYLFRLRGKLHGRSCITSKGDGGIVVSVLLKSLGRRS